MEITKKRLRQLIREEAAFIAKEERELTPIDVVAAYDENPGLQTVLKSTNDSQELYHYLRSHLTALNAQSEQADFENESASRNNLVQALLKVTREIRNNEFDWMTDEEKDDLDQQSDIN